MKVTLIGMGCGPETLTAEASGALAEADLCVGAARLLGYLPESDAARIAEYRPGAICALLEEKAPERACVLLSGDSGFYSGAAKLIPLLREQGVEVQTLPGVSSLQVLAATLGRPWQDWLLRSAHGTACDPVPAVMQGRPALFLTSGAEGPGDLCRSLTEAGLGDLPVTVGEDLGQKSERIVRGTAAEFAGKEFAPLNLLLAEPAPRYPARTPGIPDGEFLREQVPMTKQEVRAVILAKLAVGPEDVCWDVGAGTGSVSVELSQHASAVYAVERNPDAAALIRRNRKRFCAWNLRLIEKEAPEALYELPKPDAVFIGGSGGHLEEILETVCRANPEARICVSAIALETLQCAAETLQRLGLEAEVTQIGVSRTREAGPLHLLTAQNPVFLITGVGK